ncbi:MAG: uracil-DNA glycosylase [Bacteroidetes bacterium]|nr:uracil-DNA glycosylase [Bacteroidota bacterium]
MFFHSRPQTWEVLFREQEQQEYFQDLEKQIEEAYASSICFPPRQHIFRAFELCSPENLKVVILGQDPYHGQGEANGLAFAVNVGVKIPPSLRNIFKELESEFEFDLNRKTDLIHWAEQGVLLLNSVLTVHKDMPGSHSKMGWEIFTDATISFISENCKQVVFVLWGDYARRKKTLIQGQEHFIIESAHPSPLAAYRGFFGSNPFGKINSYLLQTHQQPIAW